MPAAILMVLGQRFEPSSALLESALAEAYASRLRPLCMCTPSGVEMYIAQLGSRYIVKRMPLTGNSHSVDCSASHEDKPRRPGEGSDPGLQSAEGLINLTLDAFRPKGRPRIAADACRTPRLTVVSLGALLGLLWEKADLTLWRPCFQGKRNWGVVRSRLAAAAQAYAVAGVPLQDKLYVPEVFRPQDEEAIEARRTAFWDGVRRSRRGVIMIAELKELVPSGPVARVRFKHLPRTIFSVGGAVLRDLHQSFARRLGTWTKRENVRVVVCGALVVRSGGRTDIEDSTLR